MKRIYTLIQLCLLASMYIVPYTLLAGTSGIELFTYWTLTTLLSGVIAILYLAKRGEKE